MLASPLAVRPILQRLDHVVDQGALLVPDTCRHGQVEDFGHRDVFRIGRVEDDFESSSRRGPRDVVVLINVDRKLRQAAVLIEALIAVVMRVAVRASVVSKTIGAVTALPMRS